MKEEEKSNKVEIIYARSYFYFCVSLHESFKVVTFQISHHIKIIHMYVNKEQGCNDKPITMNLTQTNLYNKHNHHNQK